ncbi:unnamed protein product [Acanthoscelides obtectus]|nr:unnamed protein product [Acanthoscelides obtectus]CAK1625795.1 Structural maintenance of chromosomes protein 3 [Acanthoscelides obtectus]
MAAAPDSYRLKVLREVAGTRVYDERREESIATLKDTMIKSQEADKLLKNIEEKLHSLEEQTEELKQYQQLDKIRRTLEFVIHEVELTANKENLANVEKQREALADVQSDLTKSLTEIQEDIEKNETIVKVARNALDALKEESEILTNDQQRLTKEKIKLELTIKDLSTEAERDDKLKQEADSRLATLTQSIAEKEAELEQLKSAYVSIKMQEDKFKMELALKEQKRKELYAKQGRRQQFSSKNERDKWIQKETEALDKQLKDKQRHKEQLEADLEKDASRVNEVKKKVAQLVLEMDSLKEAVDNHKEHIHELKKNKLQLQATRSELWRKENHVQQNLNSLKEDVIKADQKLKSVVNRAVMNGKDSVRKVIETFASRGGEEAELVLHYHGLVLDNFKCQDTIYTAVEVTAGNKLFYHIVDTEVVATKILNEMNRQKLPGEVNFMSLNRLTAEVRQYPKTSDALPIITKLMYDPKFEKVMQFIFGRTMLCRDMETSVKIAKSKGLDCVTLEGDRAESKGVLTGGYFNPHRSRLAIVKNHREVLGQHRERRFELEQLKEEILKHQVLLDNIVSEIEKTESKITKAKATYDEKNAEKQFLREELSNIEKNMGQKELLLTQCKSDLEVIQVTKEMLEAEMEHDMLSQLSVEDQQELKSLNSDIQRLQQEIKQAVATRLKLEGEKNKLENLLTNNLMKRKNKVLNTLEEMSLEDKHHQLANAKTDLEEIDSKINEIIQELGTMEKKVKEMENRMKNVRDQLEGLKKQEREIKNQIEEDAKQLEKLANKQTQLEHKINESMEKINEFGTLPVQELFNRYTNMATKALLKELAKTNKNMKKFGHINKKAFDQYLSLLEDKKKLEKRKEDVDLSFNKLQELLDTLEMKKMEAIHFTFKQCSKYFIEVFQKLVPNGKGLLVLKKMDDSKGSEENLVDNLTGIGVRVSFMGPNAEMKELNQLSGGQKTMVSLALIFAIQKCDPAPFYLFDEIDQALDPEYRRATAKMIHDLSEQAQFITTTFRPELLEHANKFYGVTFRNMASRIRCVTKEEAKDFVEDDQTR